MAQEWRQEICVGFVGLLSNWRVWIGRDELRAIDISLDLGNATVELSLLTDREPYLNEDEPQSFPENWSPGDWRLVDVTSTATSRWPDAPLFLAWLQRNSERDDADREAIAELELILNMPAVLDQLAGFSRVQNPLHAYLTASTGFSVQLQLSVANQREQRADASLLSGFTHIVARALQLEAQGKVLEAIQLFEGFLANSPPAQVGAIARAQISKLRLRIPEG